VAIISIFISLRIVYPHSLPNRIPGNLRLALGIFCVVQSLLCTAPLIRGTWCVYSGVQICESCRYARLYCPAIHALALFHFSFRYHPAYKAHKPGQGHNDHRAVGG
jgi:hypothetical protein